MKKQKIESIYPLSAMQQGLLFHSLYEPGKGTYYEHLSCRIEGELKVEAFKRAWQAVVDRHAILRTSFVWEGLKEPVQIVQQELKLVFREEDWRGGAPAEQSRKLEELLREEREQGCDLTKAPLMKLGLARVGEEAYYFIWGSHHLLFDGWCWELIIGEVFRFYEGYSRGSKVEMERGRPYRDYIAWLGEQDLSAAEEFWREELRGIEGPTELGIERSGGREEGEYKEKTVRMSEGTSRRLEEVARKWQVTLNTMVEGAWAVVMSRYSGQREVVFGATVSGRGGGLKGIEGMVGLFINTLPVRVEVGGEERVKDMLRRLHERQSRMLEYEYSPLMEVQGWSGAPRGVPLFRAAFTFQNYPLDAGIRERASSGLRISEIQHLSRNNYELAIRATPGKELLLNAIYDGGRFEESGIERLLTHLKRVLEGMAEDEIGRVMELPMMSERERQEVIVEWNQTAAEYPRDRCAHELYERQVDLTPDAVAVVYEGEQLTYHELNRRANQLAHYLREMGVGAEVQVGLCVERSLEMIVGLLGVMKAGGAYLPLDADYPPERLAYMIEDSGCPVIVTTEHLLEELPVTWAQIVMIDDDWPAIAGESDGNPELTTAPANLAYMIYTSGSTGKPKGVGLTHQGLCNLTIAQNRNVQVAAGASVLQFASFSFDAATWDWLMTLICGAKLILISGADAQSPEKILELIIKHEVETVTLPPSVLLSAAKKQIPALKTMIVAGEACPNELVRQWSGECRFINAYGPTESTVCATMTEAMVYGEKVGIGRANENTQIYILGRNQEPLPVGVTGEIYIAGLGLARSYVNRADETAEKFIANPFGAEGRRMYRTGDLGRYRKDGSIEYLGRGDDQVKIRGYRIELGEIEAALNEHPLVTQSIVLAREDEPGEKRLVGYVVGQRQVSGKELREYLRERLPDYMAPGAIVRLEAMPLTATGKIDRRTLPKPELSGAGRLYMGPRTAVEEIVCGIWAEVLRVEKVGIHDNFFELGGHSLLATQVVSRLRSALGVEVPLRVLFTNQTVAAIAAEVEQQQRGIGEAPVEAIARVARDRELPLSYAQQRLWFIDQLEPGSAVYNIPCAVRLRGQLDAEALRKSLNEIIARHEVLRTSFPSEDGEPRQEVQEVRDLQTDFIDLMESDEAERQEKLQEVLHAEAGRGFDLSSGPLIRAKLIRLAEDEHALIVNMHHIVSDGWSMEVIVGEFAQLYEAFTQGRESPLPELPIQYADYAIWQRQWLQGEALERQLAYWRERLEGLRPLELPIDRRRPPTPSHKAGVVGLQLGAEQSEGLRALSRREGATLFMTLLAGFQVALGRMAGERDVAVGTDVANRNRLEIEGLIGFFVNQLALRTSIDGNPSFVELLGRVRDTALGAYAHQDVPFEKLVEELAPERSLNRAPLFQVKFLLQNDSGARLRLPGLELSALDGPAELTKLDLILALRESPEGISGILQYAAEMFEQSTIERLGARLRTALEGIAEDADRRIVELPLLSRTEREQVLREWNETGRAYRQESVADWIEQRAAEAPDAVALALEERYVSYQELNERANRLAHYLGELGVGPEVRVALYFERGLEIVISLLSVLKAGGVYVPLDPGHPVERLAWMLEDAQAPVVLSEEKQRSRVPSSWAMVVWVDGDWAEIEQQSEANPERRVGSEDLAYVIYTSGSTGRPKGVMVTQGGLANYVRWALEAYEVEGGNGAALHGSLSFDLTVTSLLPPLSAGKPVVVVRAGDGIEAVGLRRLGLLKMTPGQMEALAGGVEAKEAGDVSGWMVVGGEALRWETVRFWRREAPGTRIINEYGPTETVVGCCAYEVREREEKWSAAPIGRPISNMRAYVTDEWGEPAGVGVAGELSIGGVGVARGYHARPDLTAEKFVPDAYGPCAGARVYRTGDRARWMEDGNLEFLGRIDDQVKIRGYRIEPGEIEAALSRQAGVRQCVVVAREDQRGDKRLVAYVAVGEPPGPAVSELRSALQGELPEYMAPSAFVLMERLPLTVNGKVDRNALPEPEIKEACGSFEPRTATEEIIAGVWAEVLERDRVGTEENFFDLGGHSLMATQVVSRLGKVFGVELPVRALFESPTVTALARQVEGAGERREAPPIERVSRDRELPLSFAQQRLWFIDQLEPGSVAYNIPYAVRLVGELDIGAVARSLSEIVRRHEALRTSFPARDGEPAQRIAPAEAAPLPVVDLSGLAEAESVAWRLAVEEARRPFDLATGPLLRASLLRLGERNHALLATMHHVVSDGWSLGILAREFTALYEAYHKAEPSPLPELPIQYGDFAVWQRAWLQGEALENRLSYWRRQLGGELPALELPADKPHPARQPYRGAWRLHMLPATLSDSLKALSLGQNCTLFMTLLAAFKTLLYYLTGQTDISVGTDIANRNHSETEKLIGFFVNQLVLRAELSRDLTFEELLKKVRKIALGAYAHQDLPFEKLVEELNPDRDGDRTPLFQVKMVLQNAPGEELSLSGLTISPVAVSTATAKFDLLLNLNDTAQGLNASLLYNTGLFEESTPARILKRFHTLLDRIVERPDARLQELIEFLLEEDRREALEKEEQLESLRLETLRGVKRKPSAVLSGSHR